MRTVGAGQQLPPDAALVAAWQAGSRAAGEALLLLYYPLIHRYVRARLADPLLAEDVVQEIFLAVIRGIDQMRDRRAFAPWLLRIARRQLAEAFQRRARERARLVSLERLESDVLMDAAETLLDDLLLAELLLTLPVALATVVTLRGQLGLPEAEIAARTGQSVRTVQRRLEMARQLLRREAAPEEP